MQADETFFNQRVSTETRNPEKHQWKTTELYASYMAEKGNRKQEYHSSDRKTGKERRRHCCLENLKLAAFRMFSALEVES